MQHIPHYAIPTQSNTQPILGQSIIGQPIQGQPIYGQPIQGQPIYGQPIQGQPIYGQPILSQTTTTYQPIPNQPMSNNTAPETCPRELISQTEPIHSDFGKVKAIEVLFFKDAELERTIGSETVFAGVGICQVLYFKNYDRFVLSLKDWKYPLLRRVPIVCTGQLVTGPFYYNLPTYNGFYTLKLNKITHPEALQNFETILRANSKFSQQGAQGVIKRELSPDDRFKEHADPFQTSLHEVPPQSEVGQPSVLTKKDKIKRGFQAVAFKLTKGLSRKGKHNLNLYQVRDMESIKRTSEITVPFFFYPKKEVERWITYSKEIANRNNFEPELGYDDSMTGMNSPMSNESAGRMRGYGSVDLGQGHVSDPLSSKILSTGITTERPEDLHLYSSTTGTTSGIHSHDGYSKVHFMDKVKVKLPGTHHYHGEKVEGHTYGTHSNPVHNSIIDKVKTKITGHADYPHQGLANPTGAAIVSVDESATTKEVIAENVHQIVGDFPPTDTTGVVAEHSTLTQNNSTMGSYQPALKENFLENIIGHNNPPDSNIATYLTPDNYSLGRREEFPNTTYTPSTYTTSQQIGGIPEQQYFAADQA